MCFENSRAIHVNHVSFKDIHLENLNQPKKLEIVI